MTDLEHLACMGATASALRALRDDERGELASERRSAGWRATWLVLSIPIALLASVALAACLAMVPGVGKVLAMLSIAAGPFGGGLLAILALDCFRRRWRIGRELARAEVLAFEGRTRGTVSERMRQRLAGEGFPVDGALRVAFEVLAATGRLWSIDGVRSDAWMLLPLLTYATVPDHAAVAAEWVKPFASMGGATLLGRRRALSSDETTEIAALHKRMLRRRGRDALVTAIAVAALVRGGLGSRELVLRAAAIVMGLLFMGRAARLLVADVTLARKLSRDQAEGMVVIVRVTQAGGDTMSPASEILPRSRPVWTQEGAPALWRRGGGAPVTRG